MKLDPEVIRLYKMGFAIHWLRRKSKIPIEKGWTSGPRLTLSELQERYRPGNNVGVRLGRPSAIGEGYLAVLDLDVKSEDPAHREEAMAWLRKHYPEAAKAPCMMSGRGNGSAHFYVRVKEPVSKNELKGQSKEIVQVKIPSVPANPNEKRKLGEGLTNTGIRLRHAWEVSLYCEGRQSVLAGSIHPDTGNAYEWKKRPKSIDDFPWIKTIGLVTPEKEPVKRVNGTFHFPDVDLQTLGLRPDQLDMLVDGTGVIGDRSGPVLSLCMAMVKRNVDDETIISVLTDSRYYLGRVALERRGGSRESGAEWIRDHNLRKAKLWAVEQDVFDTAETAEGSQWMKELEIGGNPPRVKASFMNLRLILANRCETPLFLKHDDFSNNEFFTCDTPWGNTKGQKRSGNNVDALKVKNWLNVEYDKMEAQVGLIEEIFQTVADENHCHPLREYLEGLEWDGKHRVATAFKRYMGARMPEPYLSDVTRKFFIACVKRAFEPGCKFDHVPILEGLQGKGKSTFIRYLVGDEWFMDALPSMADKDAAHYLQGVWVCELGELATINKSGLDMVKGFIARTTDKFRPPYGHRRVDFPRTTLFVGTTDQNQYLNDPAGNRRFWPITVTQCDFKGVLRDRDQLWAEAVWLYLFDEEPLWLQGDSAQQVLAVQGTRRIEDENDSLLMAWDNWIKTGDVHNEVKISELFNAGMPFFSFQQTQANMRAAARILQVRQFKCKHTRNGNVWVHMKG